MTRLNVDRVAPLIGRARSSLPVRCLERFRMIHGRDRVLVLAGQAFTTIIPLMIVVAAVASGRGENALGDRFVAKFHLSGDAADAVRTLFAQPPNSTGAITVAGVVLLLFSLLSLTRSLQRTYEAAWQLPPQGIRGTLYGLSGMGLLLAELIVLTLVASLLKHVWVGTALNAAVRVLAAVALWLVLQELLLSRRVTRRQLIPGAVVAGVGQVVVSIFSALWMPRLVSQNAERYGIIGVTFALLSWLIVLAACVVAAAVISAEFGRAGALTVRPDSPVAGEAGEVPATDDGSADGGRAGAPGADGTRRSTDRV